jgi:hypothetical protein
MGHRVEVGGSIWISAIRAVGGGGLGGQGVGEGEDEDEGGEGGDFF